MTALRVLIDPPASGTWNMAVDEALLEFAAASGPATLRFYSWQAPTLSLGYFQAAEDRRLHSASRACPVVRRASGGGAIIHDRELTYSLVLPQTNSRSIGSGALYHMFHVALVETLNNLDVHAAIYEPDDDQCGTRHDRKSAEPFLCFQRRCCGDVVLASAKIAGSAQRRRHRAVLQHGSILLARSMAAPELPGIEELTGRTLSAEDIIDPYLQQVVDRLSLTPTAGALTAAESARADEIERNRFGSADFQLRR